MLLITPRFPLSIPTRHRLRGTVEQTHVPEWMKWEVQRSPEDEAHERPREPEEHHGHAEPRDADEQYGLSAYAVRRAAPLEDEHGLGREEQGFLGGSLDSAGFDGSVEKKDTYDEPRIISHLAVIATRNVEFAHQLQQLSAHDRGWREEQGAHLVDERVYALRGYWLRELEE